MSALCRACSRHMFTCDIGSCKTCGQMTSSGGFKLCSKCAIDKDQCASCSKSIVNEPEDDLDAPRNHIVSFGERDEVSVKNGYTRKQVLDHFAARMKVLVAELRKWFDENGLAHVKITNELSNIRTIFIACSLNEAKKVEKAPGVVAISRGD